MKDRTFEQEFKIRFNFQNWLKEDIDENDAVRIGKALNIDEDIVRECIADFAETVASQARLLDRKNRYSDAIDTNATQSIVFIGDSITSERLSFSKIIRQTFAGTHRLTFIDAGVSGWRTTDFVDELYCKVLGQKADAAHIMLGTNGIRRSRYSYGISNVSPDEFKRNLGYMLSALRDRNIKIVVSTLPPYHLEAQTYRDGNWTIDRGDYDAFNEAICAYEEKPNILVNDMRNVYGGFSAEELLEEDGVHLNIKGNALLAKHVIEKLINCLHYR